MTWTADLDPFAEGDVDTLAAPAPGPAVDLAPEPDPRERQGSGEDRAERKSAASVLVDLARERYDLGVTEDGDAYAVPLPAGHVVRMLRGGKASLRAELASAYLDHAGKVAPQQALADALLVLEGMAQRVEPVPVHLRIAEHGGAVWVDLGDTAERAVRVDAGGWAVVADGVPVRFARTALTGALPTPGRGDLAALWRAVNVAEADRPLVLAWLVAAILRPNIPHPILAVFGEQGSGKSTASRALVQMVDPSPVPLRKPPRESEGWVTAAAGSYVVGLDNLSTVPEWLSDSLCRAATGEGDVRRRLYTDAGLAVFAFRRCILLNGIDVGAMRGDLAERLLLVNLERITEDRRRTETELDAEHRAAYPAMFGALLDLVARVSARLPSVRLATSPRMADFATVLAAVDAVLGTAGLARYAEQARTIAEDTLAADPFLVAIRTALAGTFVGTAAELRDAVTPTADDGWRPPRDWPKSARTVTSLIRRNAPALRKAGWTVEDLGAGYKDHATRWEIHPPEIARIDTSPRSPNSPSQVRGTIRGEVVKSGEVAPNSPTSPYLANPDALTSTNEVARKASNRDGPSQDDGPRAPLCRVCGRVLAPAVADLGTHPTCDPEATR